MRIPAPHVYKNENIPGRICRSAFRGGSGRSGRHLCRTWNGYFGNQFQRPCRSPEKTGSRCMVFPDFSGNRRFFTKKMFQRRFVDNYGSRRRCEYRGRSSCTLSYPHYPHFKWEFINIWNVDFFSFFSIPKALIFLAFFCYPICYPHYPQFFNALILLDFRQK